MEATTPAPTSGSAAVDRSGCARCSEQIQLWPQGLPLLTTDDRITVCLWLWLWRARHGDQVGWIAVGPKVVG